MSQSATPDEHDLYAIVTDDGDMVDVFMSEAMARDELSDGLCFPDGKTRAQCRIVVLLAKEVP